MSFRLTILGAPRTKKNSPDIILLRSKDGRGQACPCCKAKLLTIVQPSAAWRTWAKDARVMHAEGEVVRLKLNDELVPYFRRNDGTGASKLAPLAFEMNMEATYYRDANRGDLMGYHDGLADFLQFWGIITNDVLIRTTDGSRLSKDAENPRVEVVLTPLAQHVPRDRSTQGDLAIPESSEALDPVRDR